MKRLIQLLLIFTVSVHYQVQGQKIDNTASFSNQVGDRYFRIHYDNDFYGNTDYYYTQGYQFELVNPLLIKNPISNLLLKLKDSHVKYGLSFEHYGFTPTSYRSDDIRYGDRPFAGVIMLKSFAISVNSQKRTRLSSIISTGMIGPAAFAGNMQATIHKWTGDATPHGWQNQIHNDIVVNYGLKHEFELFNIPNIFSLNTNTNIDVGTLSDKMQAGFTFTAGRFDSPFKTLVTKSSKNFQLYLYVQPLISFVGYDAALQGGIFNRSSPYTIPGKDVSRTTFQAKWGLVAQIWKIYFEYNRAYLTQEFRTGKSHKWGGLRMGYSF